MVTGHMCYKCNKLYPATEISRFNLPSAEGTGCINCYPKRADGDNGSTSLLQSEGQDSIPCLSTFQIEQCPNFQFHTLRCLVLHRNEDCDMKKDICIECGNKRW